MANKTWKLTVNEEELRALINHNNNLLFQSPTPEISLRLHDLVKRLNKETPEIELATDTKALPATPAMWGSNG